MTRYLSEEEPTGKITITHEEAMRELGKIEDDYSEIRQLKKQIAEMHQADLNRLATIEELVRCLENAIKFVYHYYGDKEALADMETHTWRTIVKDIRRAEQSVHWTLPMCSVCGESVARKSGMCEDCEMLARQSQ